MSFKDRLIQFVLSGKDELSPAAKKAAKSLSALTKEADELGEALDAAQETRGLVRELQATERNLKQAETAADRAAKRIAAQRTG